MSGAAQTIEIRRSDGSLIGAYPGANIREALVNAARSGADLGGAYLRGERPVVQYGPVGSESRTVVGYVTDRGLRIRAGCFFGDLAEFREAIADTHGENTHGREYALVADLFERHAELWTQAGADS